MAWNKAKTTLVTGVVLILAAGMTTVMVSKSGHHSRVKLEWTPAERDAFEAESRKRIHDAKWAAMDCFVFAESNHNQWPTSLAQLKAGYPKDGQADLPAGPLSDSTWEFVASGNRNAASDPANTVLFRERESRPSPLGEFVKVYVFANGSVELLSSRTEDFAGSEKERGLTPQSTKGR